MKTLDFARTYITFRETSPITGPFRDEMYPFLRKPMETADDILCKRMTIYKSSSSMGSVLGEIINTKRVLCDAGSQIMVCQSDDKADQWSKTRGKQWLRNIADIDRLISKDKYAITNSLWLFRHKWLSITGPGINNAQSDQCRYLQSDEGHLEAYGPGCLVEWEKRMGGRWDRQATHITTAADDGKEVDRFYYQGDQNEFHWRCINCYELIWPLWANDAKELYNGKEIFEELPSGEMIAVCPHCQSVYHDTARARYSLVKDGDYVRMNHSSARSERSYRWNVFAAHWVSWKEMNLEYKAAIESAKIGDLKPLEDWEKKRLCKSWKPTLPDFGEGKGKSDYKLDAIWSVSESLRVITADPQAGIADEGFHIHGLLTEWTRDGSSRRQRYSRLNSFMNLEVMQINGKVRPEHVMVDAGWDARTVFRECGRRQYYAFRGSDSPEFMHEPTRQNGGVTIPHMPYNQPVLESGIVGTGTIQKVRAGGRGCPPGWCWVITGANPMLYGYVNARITGSSGVYFGIPSDMDQCYVENMPAFIPIIESNTKTGQVKKLIWKLVRKSHYWDLEVMATVVACRAGFYPLAKSFPIETP